MTSQPFNQRERLLLLGVFLVALVVSLPAMFWAGVRWLGRRLVPRGEPA